MKRIFKKIMTIILIIVIGNVFSNKVYAAQLVTITHDDVSRLERLVYAEAGNQTLEAQKLVCVVILNRCYSEDFPNTVEEVIKQKTNGVYQFSCVSNGMYDNAIPTEQVKQAVSEVLSEYFSDATVYPTDVLFFRSGYYFGWQTVKNYTNEDNMYFSRLA